MTVNWCMECKFTQVQILPATDCNDDICHVSSHPNANQFKATAKLSKFLNY